MSNEECLNESLRKIAKGAGIGFTGSFIGMALGYLSMIVIARLLDPSDYGLILLGFAGMSIATTLAMVGLPTGVQRYVSFCKGKGDEGRIKGTILGAVKISFPLSLITAFLLFSCADWISMHVLQEPNLAPILKIFSIAIPFFVLSSNFIAATIGFQDLRYKVYVNDLFMNVVKLAAIVIFLVMGFGVLGATWGWALALIGMPFLSLYFLEKKVFPVFSSKIKSVPMEKEIFSFSWPLIFAGVAGFLRDWTDTIMLAYFLTASSVGIYNVALPTAGLLRILGKSFSTIFMPVITELYAKNREEELKRVYATVTKWVISLVLPGFLLMALFSETIIRIIFGVKYVDGATALSILALGFSIYCVFGIANSVIWAYGKTKLIMVGSFIGAGMNVVLNFLLIPIYGINGAAVATGLSIILPSILYLFFVYRIGKMQPFRMNHLKPVFASMVSVLVVYGLTKYIIGESFISFIVMFFVFLLIYFFLLLILKGFEEEDLMIMSAIDERLGIKTDLPRKIIRMFL